MKTIRLNERRLRNIIKEAVKKTLNEEMGWPFRDDDEIWVQIAKEGGKSWTDEENNIHLYIEEEEKPSGQKIYVVRDEEDGVIAYSQYLHKAQRSLHDAVVDRIELERIKTDGLRDENGTLI